MTLEVGREFNFMSTNEQSLSTIHEVIQTAQLHGIIRLS